MPERSSCGVPDISNFLATERRIGNAGIGMIDRADPLCHVASLFDFGTYTVIALTEQKLFRCALDKISRWLFPRVEAVAKMLPGRLWRIVGPEYASPPYLPPRLFSEYVTKYDRHIVEIIHRYDGFARIHSHGRLKDILDDICATGCMGLDPIEPPPQGDVELSYVRFRHGKQLVLFGNIEVSDIENLPTEQFAKKVTETLRQGTVGEGRGFVLMPTACPVGRVLSPLTLKNYEKIIEVVEKIYGY